MDFWLAKFYPLLLQILKTKKARWWQKPQYSKRISVFEIGSLFRHSPVISFS